MEDKEEIIESIEHEVEDGNKIKLFATGFILNIIFFCGFQPLRIS